MTAQNIYFKFWLSSSRKQAANTLWGIISDVALKFCFLTIYRKLIFCDGNHLSAAGFENSCQRPLCIFMHCFKTTRILCREIYCWVRDQKPNLFVYIYNLNVSQIMFFIPFIYCKIIQITLVEEKKSSRGLFFWNALPGLMK